MNEKAFLLKLLQEVIHSGADVSISDMIIERLNTLNEDPVIVSIKYLDAKCEHDLRYSWSINMDVCTKCGKAFGPKVQSGL
jgi:hypothetical protein